jgi:hypothetical protein
MFGIASRRVMTLLNIICYTLSGCMDMLIPINLRVKVGDDLTIFGHL